MSSAIGSASIVRDFFMPFVGFALISIAIFRLLVNPAFAVYITALIVIIGLLFQLKLSLPSNDKSRLEEFFFSSGFENRSAFIVSHRTTALDAPENSISGIREAKKNGFPAVEFDVQNTKDEVLVLFHDSTLDRTSDGVGRVDQSTLEDLKKLDISAKHLRHDNFKHETIATLDEAVDECERLGLKIFIDVKSPNGIIFSKLVELLDRKNDLLKHAMVVCWSPIFLYKIRKQHPSLLTGLVWRPMMVSLSTSTGLLEHGHSNYSEKWKQLLARIGDHLLDFTYRWLLWYPCGVSTLLAHKDTVSKESIRFWNNRGIRVLTWPVNDPLEKQYLTGVLKIDGYLTDTYLPKP